MSMSLSVHVNKETIMSTTLRVLAVSVALAGGAVLSAAPVLAAPIGQPSAVASAATHITDQVRWRGGWGWGGAVVGGLAAGALIGGALASPYYYGPAYYPAYPYGAPAYYAPPAAYGPPPGYGPPPQGDEETYCLQRYRSYDPNTGTFLGNDGRRHPCP